MADITLTVDVSSLANASKKLQAFGTEVSKFSVIGLSRGINTLQSNIRELVSAQRQGTIGSSAYQLGLLQIKRAYEKMGYSTQVATAAVRKYAAEVQRQEAARAAEQAARELARAQQEAAAAAQKLADRQRDLRRRFQEGYALFEQQRKAMRDLREAYRANIITLEQYQARLAAIRAGNLGQHMNQQAQGMSRFGLITQQAGYQIGDFFVQVQSGTNVLVAFGQQATQIIGTFAALATSVKAIAFFSGLAILVSIGTAIGSYFMRASGASKTLKDSVSDLEQASTSLRENFKLLRKEGLDKTFGNMTTSVKGLTEALLQLDMAADMRRFELVLEKLGAAAKPGFFDKAGATLVTGFEGSVFAPFDTGLTGLGEVDEVAYQKLGFSMARAQFFAYREELLVLAKAGDREGVVKLIEEMTQDATDFGATANKVSESGYQLLSEIGKVAASIAETAALLNGSSADAERLAEAEKVKAQHAERYYQLQLEQDALNKERDADVQSLIDKRDEEYRRLVQERDMLQAIHAFGKDSVEVRELEAKFAREAYEADLKKAVGVGNFLTLLMEEYDLTAAVKKEMEDMSPLQREINDYANQFAQVDLASGVDAAAAAALQLAKQLGISFDRAKGMMELGYGAPVIYNPMDPNYDPEAAVRGRAKEFAATRGGFTHSRTVTGTEFADDKEKGGKGDPLEELRKQIELENELLGVSEAQARVIQALGDKRGEYSQKEIDLITAEIEAYNQKLEAVERTKQIMDTVKSSMEDAFMSMVDGTKSAKDAFRSMAAEIIKELYRVLVVQQLVNSISGAIGGIFGGSAAPTSSPRPMPRPPGLPFGGPMASGGPVDANKVYLVGEQGPELVIPRYSGTVVNAAQTAQALGGGSGDITVQNNITVTGSDAAMVRVEIAKMIPQITNATKAAVIDAKQRGGQMAAAFR